VETVVSTARQSLIATSANIPGSPTCASGIAICSADLTISTIHAAVSDLTTDTLTR
jgi:tRNA A37 threonylcarbamoyladenosine synthetase subunit TsaC/SUA5/YrdC